MPDFAVIIPAAGESSRFQGFATKKPFVELGGRAIWLRAADHFLGRPDVTEVVVVLAQNDIDEFRERFNQELTSTRIVTTRGGDSRAESVQNGLAALSKSADFVAVHDAARPLLTQKLLEQIFDAAVEHGAVVPGIPVTSTVKRVNEDGMITETVDRTDLRLAQTPQVFRREVLEHAYATVTNPAAFTDEASLVEAAGHSVFVCPGLSANLKITTADDFQLAALLLEQAAGHNQSAERPPIADDHFR